MSAGRVSPSDLSELDIASRAETDPKAPTPSMTSSLEGARWTEQPLPAPTPGNVVPEVGQLIKGGRFLPDLVIVFPMRLDDTLSYNEISRLLSDILVEDDSEDEEESTGTYNASKALKRRKEAASLREVQEAVRQDIVRYLAQKHCRMHTFASVDDDELFLLVSMGDSEVPAQFDNAALEFAHAKRYRFQTKLTRTNLNEKLKLLQDMRSDLDATYLNYRRDVVTQAEQAFCPLKVEGTGETDSSTTILRQYSAGVAGARGSIMRTVDRIRLLVGDLEQFVDLEDCVGCGIVSSFYAVHAASKLEEFRSGQTECREKHQPGHVPWANFRPAEILMSIHPAYGPPVQEIRDYFGEMIGFYFLWLQHTTSSLIWLLPFAIVFEVLIQAFNERKTIQSQRATALVVFSSAIFVNVWSQFYVKSWRRLENYYRVLWGISVEDFVADARRPDYVGDTVPNPINQNVFTKMYSPWRKRGVVMLAYLFTIFFMGLVLVTVVLIYRYEQQLTQTGASILFSIQIFTYQFVWDILSEKLVEFQNPRTENEAKNMDVQILFPFSLISAYANIAYHAVWSEWNHSCWEEDCTRVMRPSLYQVVLPALLAQVASMLKPYVLFRFALYWEARQLRKHGRKEFNRSFIEVQAKRPPFRAGELNSEMNIMAVLLGYVLLFGCVAPGVQVAVFVTFLLKIRIDGFKLCNVYQRVLPARLPPDGIGEWDKVVRMLADIGRATSLAIPIFNLGYFNNTGSDETFLGYLGADEASGLNTLQKLVLWFALKEILDYLCRYIDYLIDDQTAETKLMIAKRRKASRRLHNRLAIRGKKGSMAWANQQPHPSRSCSSLLSPRAKELLQEADWKTTKHLDETDLWSKVETEDFGLPFEKQTYFG